MHTNNPQQENPLRDATLEKEPASHTAALKEGEAPSARTGWVDNVSQLLNARPEFDGLEFAETRTSCTCTIHRKDRKVPIQVTEYLRECRRESAPWKSHPRRMLRHAALIQCARIAFGIAAPIDAEHGRPNEPDRVYKTRMTPHSAALNHPPEGFREYEAARLPALQDAARAGKQKLSEAFSALPPSPLKQAFWTLHGAQLKNEALRTERTQ